MKTILHKAITRGHFEQDWLNTYHTFSFGTYYNPERIHFGMLRVLNDDSIAAGMGFGTHPHDNMEIITIPLCGSLAHKDSMGHTEVINTGDVQVMSAGSGITHSEYNHSREDSVELLQIWVFPKIKNVIPRYQQYTFAQADSSNKIQTIISPIAKNNCLWIHQQAWFSLTNLDEKFEVTYRINEKENGIYVFVIEGSAAIKDILLNKRDGLAITEAELLQIKAITNCKLLLMEVPMR